MTEENRSNTYEVGRRDYLLSTAALGTASITQADDLLTTTTTTDEFSNRVQSTDPANPPYPDDPFMPGQFAVQYLSPNDRFGWEEASVREEYRTLLGLHLDVFDSAGLAVFSDGDVLPDEDTSRALSLSFRTGLPTTAGKNTTITLQRADELQPILDEQDWKFPNGSSLDSVSGSYAETFSGEKQIINFAFTDNGIPSAFAPLGLHLTKVVAKKRLSQGFSGFFVDKVFNNEGLDFSQWARGAFRDYIQSLPTSRREKLDVEDPSTFDIREYLRKNDLTPASGRDPREDPVFREYVLHNHLGIQNYLVSLRNALTDEFPDRFERGDAALWANQHLIRLYGPGPVEVYGSPYFDIINTEINPTVNPAVDHKYKLLQAVGNFEKPAIAKGTLKADDNPPKGEDYPDSTKEYPNLERFQLAESHANGARLKIPLSTRGAFSADESITKWIRPDGTVPKTLQRVADFVWTQKRFLTDSSPANPVAVIFSLPDRMYRRLPQWDIGNFDSHDGIDAFVGATKLLRESQIPYTVLVFGHPDLWDDTVQLDRLSAHDAVILPDIDCLTDEQYSALEEYLDQGGHLVSSGAPPSRNGRYGQRDDVDQLFNNDNAVVLDNNPALNREQNGDAGSQLQDTLADAGIQSYTDRQDSTLSVNVREQSIPSRTVVHLLNYDYSTETDSFDAKNNIEITLPAPDHAVGVARYYSEQQTIDVGVDSSDQTVTFTIPKLTDWGFVVLARSESELVPREDESAAKETVRTLREEIISARENGYDWSPTFTIAETRLNEATKALDADAYSQALSAAKKGISAAEKLDRQQPVVGIDLSHGQSAGFSRENSFEHLKTNIAYPEYRMIDSWSNDILTELDILIIPPALTYRGERHEFTQTEIDEISRFVENGGSIVILARGGVAPDMASLTSEFGYAFDRRPIKFPSDARPVAPTAGDHELIQAVPEMSVRLGTTIVDMPDDATTLASMPEDNEAWFHEERPIDERNENEEDVPADPIYAISTHGSGTVVVLGSWNYLHVPEGVTHWTPVVHNLFTTLSMRVANSRKNATDTPTATQTTTSEDQDEQTTGEGGPGFGIVGGLAGITGLAALARRLKDSDD